MDLVGLGAFLRTRRAALQPEDVGLPRGPRRRTSGLRREEVASLVGMSPDYYARRERSAGTQPSEQMVAAIARGLRLSLPERDHLFTLSGPVDAHHRQVRFTWGLGPEGAEPLVMGFDVAVCDGDGRLSSVLGFLDRVPA